MLHPQRAVTAVEIEQREGERPNPLRDTGFELVGHFSLPDEAWWDDFYTPMEARIAELRAKYTGDLEASTILDQLAEEPKTHRLYSDFYAYEFFVARRTSLGK